MGSEMWYVFDFSWKIVVIIVQSELKLYDLTVIAAGAVKWTSLQSLRSNKVA